MNLRIRDGEICINIRDMFSGIPPAEKRAALEEMACDSDVIEFVAQQILARWTENGNSGDVNCLSAVWPRGLDRATREVAKASGEVAKREIEKLEDSLKQEVEYNQRLRDTIAGIK